MNFPENLKYTKDHEWIKVQGDIAYIGITDFAQTELGDVVFVEVESLGERVNKQETFGTIEAVKTVSDLFMPISGDVVEINPELESSPEIINKDPYGKGWIIKMNIGDISELDDLMDAEQYKDLVNV